MRIKSRENFVGGFTASKSKILQITRDIPIYTVLLYCVIYIIHNDMIMAVAFVMKLIGE